MVTREILSELITLFQRHVPRIPGTTISALSKSLSPAYWPKAASRVHHRTTSQERSCQG